MPDPDANTVFSERLRLAWEHFRFHAEQRTRMFHFFLLAAALLLNAFSLLTRSEVASYQEYAFVLLCIGGVLSTLFLSLDVRNTQLLEASETLLRKIEEDTLYKDWRGEIDGRQIKLGILSREAVLKDYVRSNDKIRSGPFCRWFFVDNIKHSFAIRFIQVFAILCFWIGAFVATPSKITVSLVVEVHAGYFVLMGLVICLVWAVHALWSPQRHLKWEHEALKQLDARRDRAEGTGSS